MQKKLIAQVIQREFILKSIFIFSIELVGKIICVIFISIGVQEATDDAIEQILAEEEKNGALDVIFDRVDDENEEQDEEEAIDEQFFTDMISNFESNFNMQFEWNIAGVYCSAHNVQLGVNDAQKQLPKSHQNVIELCRQATKFLRKKSTIHELNAIEIYYSLPRLDGAIHI